MRRRVRATGATAAAAAPVMVLLAFAAAVLPPSPASAGTAWEKLVLGKAGRGLPAPIAAAWEAEIRAAGAGPLDVAYAAFPASDGLVVVSVAYGAPTCGPTRPDGSTPCRGRVDFLGLGHDPVAIPAACFMPDDPTWTGGADRATTGTWASLDAATGAVSLVAARDGAAIDGCAVSVDLRSARVPG